MPRTVDHIVEIHKLASARATAGLPVWNQQIDVSSVFYNKDLSFTEKRDRIVAILRKSPWLEGVDEFSELVWIVDGLATAEDAKEFDGWWSDLYDQADYDRVWIKLH